MRLRHVYLTFGKELREALRDRRTLAIMILLPLVVYPLLSMLAAQVATGREKARETRPSTVAVVGETSAAQALVDALSSKSSLFLLKPSGTQADVERGALDALVQMHAEKAGEAAVLFDASRDESRIAEERLTEVLGKALPEGCAPRFVAASQSVAPQARLGGYLLSKALPLFVVLMVLLGAFYPAIDVTAGERERGTLETVLSSPIRRVDLMLGKVLAVAALAALTGVLNLASMAITVMQIVRLSSQTLVLDVPWGHALASTLVIVPAALLFAAAFVALGATARTFKEAQTLLMPAYFVSVTPALIGAIGEYPLTGLAIWTPGMNLTLLARDLLVGRAGIGAVLGVLTSTVGFAAIALLAAARIYDSERLVVPARRDKRAPSVSQDVSGTSAADGMVLFALAFLLLYFVFLPLERRFLTAGLLVAEWAGLFGLVALYARMSGRRFRDVLVFSRPAPRHLLGAALIGASAWAAVAIASQWIVPVPKAMLEELRRVLVPLDGSRSYAMTLLTVALTPAICEEALFRGPVLRGLRTRLGPVAAVALSALLFGLFHMDVYRLLPTTLLGLALGVIALSSRSIVPCFLAHFLNNAILVSLAYAKLDQRLEDLGHGALILIVVASLSMTGLGLFLLRERPDGRKV